MYANVGQPQDITGISQQVVDLCNGDSIVLKGYSYGYVYWGITPEPFRMANTTVHSDLHLWPVPAAEDVYVQFTLPDESAIYTYRLYSVSGHVVLQGIFPESGYLTVPRKHMAAGMYLFQLTTTTGEVVGLSKIVWE